MALTQEAGTRAFGIQASGVLVLSQTVEMRRRADIVQGDRTRRIGAVRAA
jgi:hypothetical protein